MYRRRVLHTPRYMLRKGIVRQALRLSGPLSCLEIGCGTGELLADLVRWGHSVVGVEPSPVARPLAERAAASCGGRARVVPNIEVVAGEHFDCCLALEVLEHIEKDLDALVSWRQLLRHDGQLLLTVPAHMAKWTFEDEAGGHWRRYEKDELCKLVEASGFRIDVCWNYGFPTTGITVPLRRILSRRRANSTPIAQRTAMSSFHSEKALPDLLGPMAGAVEAIGWFLHCCQLPFRNLDLGDGYLIVAKPI